MNCYNHPKEPAAAICPDCGIGLCATCVGLHAFPVCTRCNGVRKNSEKKQILGELTRTFGIGLFLALLTLGEGINPLTFMNPILSFFFRFYMGSSLMAGWAILNRWTPGGFLILPLIGWVIYLTIKGIVSIYVGMVMLPVRTLRNLRRLKALGGVKVQDGRIQVI